MVVVVMACIASVAQPFPGLKGHVHSMREEVTAFGHLPVALRGIKLPRSEMWFDQDGRVIEEKQYDPLGRPREHMTQRYVNGQIMERIVESDDPDYPARLLGRTIYRWEGHQLIGTEVFNPDGSLRERTVNEKLPTGSKVTRYDAAGNVIGESDYLRNTDGTVSHTKRVEDGKTVMESDIERLPGGASRVKTVNNAGETQTISENDELGSRSVSVNSRVGSVSTTMSSRDHSTTTMSIERDSRGRPGGKRIRNETRREGDRIVEQVRYENDVPVQRTTYAYEADAHGNWIRQTVSLTDMKTGGQPTVETILERTITYY